MKNTHLEHPEDSILSGDLTALDWMIEKNSHLSVKIDGSPAIVWGRNPATGNQFVGTKSVFNKKLIKICESIEDIDKFYSGDLRDILTNCLANLPITKNIYQGDFIGFGGNYTYTPNTITYKFDRIISQRIIIAPHTVYQSKKDLRDAVAHPLLSNLSSTTNVLFVAPDCGIVNDNELIKLQVNFAKQMATLCEFPTENKVITRLKKHINTCIREGIEIDELTQDALASDNNVDVNVIRLWKLVEAIKIQLFTFIRVDESIGCEIEEHDVDHEGYVMTNKFGSFKIIDREVFSYLNFNLSKNRDTN